MSDFTEEDYIDEVRRMNMNKILKDMEEREKKLIAEFLQDLKECKNKMYPGSLTNRKLDEKIEKWEGKQK